MTKPSKCVPSEDSDQPGQSPQSDQSSLSAWRKLGSLATHWMHSEDSDQTGRMPRLIWVFAGRKDHFVDFVMGQLNFCFFLPVILMSITWSVRHPCILWCSSLPLNISQELVGSCYRIMVMHCWSVSLFAHFRLSFWSFLNSLQSLNWQRSHHKTNKVSVHPAKSQISLDICPVRSVFTVRSVGS